MTGEGKTHTWRRETRHDRLSYSTLTGIKSHHVIISGMRYGEQRETAYEKENEKGRTKNRLIASYPLNSCWIPKRKKNDRMNERTKVRAYKGHTKL